MESKLQEILLKYWGHRNFRPLQKEIISSVLEGKDTLALLPTGGGKSICFQVPAMYLEGICVVISPLIALMKDQVENLNSKGIKALALNSTMSKREIDIALDNCVHGGYKFLYLSPERLHSEIVKVRLQKMKVNLIAVDESHCISQWGYDFRPSYLKIAELRTILPGIPVLALTATATSDVVDDIQERLLFKKKNVFRKSFERKNLSYVVLHEEDKFARLIRIIKNTPGSGIVYARNRMRTQEIAAYLRDHNIAADHYHAGLLPQQRDQKQQAWIQNKIRVISCTNAFGMGIDKPDVRFVVHMDPPDNLESYFQEAGRAGRDEQKAYAVLLYTEADKLELERNFESSFPPMEEIRQVYQALVNFYQIPAGSGEGHTVEFDISKFCDTYQLKAIPVFNSLKFIEREGYISLSDAIYQPSRIKLEMNREDLYKFQISNRAMDVFIKLLLRNYSGLFDHFVKISEFDLAKKAELPKAEVIKRLNYLHQLKVLHYAPQTELPQLQFLVPRVDTKNLHIAPEHFSMLKKRNRIRLDAMLSYAGNAVVCRSRQLLAYFGDLESEDCGHCDVCLEAKKKKISSAEYEMIYNQVKALLSVHPLDLKQLVNAITDTYEEKIIKVIQLLLDEEKIRYNQLQQLELIHP